MTKPNRIQPPTRRCDQKVSPGDRLLTALDLCATDYCVLMTARYFFVSFTNPKEAAWMSVILSSEDFFPNHCNSPAIVQSVLRVVHAIRTSRRPMLRFSNPHCLNCNNIVTAAECHFIAILSHVRSGNFSTATTHAMLLCEGNDMKGVLGAVTRLTELTADTRDV